MFENITKFFKKIIKKENSATNSKDTAKERLHLVLMQDRANVSADFLDLMRQEIIDVIKKYIEVDESAIDVRLTNKENEDGTNGAPALYANIPIISIKEEAKKEEGKLAKEKKKAETDKEVQGNKSNINEEASNNSNVEESKVEAKQQNEENDKEEKIVSEVKNEEIVKEETNTESSEIHESIVKEQQNS